MEKEFYSQFGQDRFLETTIFRGYKNGVFMDIGAHDGITINNTLYFEKNNNWVGINIEPNRRVFDLLVANRPDSININCAISNSNGEGEFFQNSGYTEMISGLKAFYEHRHMARLLNENLEYGGTTEIVDVQTRTFNFICEEYDLTHINYLSIDVEGGEYEIIKTINFNKVFIDVIMFENNYQDTTDLIVEFLKYKNYFCVNRTTLIIYMIHQNSNFIRKHE